MKVSLMLEVFMVIWDPMMLSLKPVIKPRGSRSMPTLVMMEDYSLITCFESMNCFLRNWFSFVCRDECCMPWLPWGPPNPLITLMLFGFSVL